MKFQNQMAKVFAEGFDKEKSAFITKHGAEEFQKQGGDNAFAEHLWLRFGQHTEGALYRHVLEIKMKDLGPKKFEAAGGEC